MTEPAIPSAISPARLGEIVLGTEVVNGREVPKYKRNRFVNLLNRELMAMAAGEFDKLAVSAPPRHGKTTILNVLFAAWFLGTFPDKQVIVASHSATLASKFGMQVRDILEEFGPSLFGVRVRQDRRAVDNWSLTAGGGMLSIGVGGSLVGWGADLFIFDDIIADAAAALSEVVRNNTMDWYESTAETRINSGGLQVFTMQRWHGDDPYQRVVKNHPLDWRDIDIPAIADHDPSKGEADPLGRPPGEALWPEKYPLRVLLAMQARKPFWFAAQYQQRPTPRGGGMFQTLWIEDNAVWYRPDTETPRVRWWDRAATEGDGDFTAGVRMSRKGDHYYIEDVRLGQWGSGNRDREIRATCRDDNERYPHAVVTWSEQEPGSSGKDSAAAFTKMLEPYAAHCETSTGSKVVRADSLATAFSEGRVHVCKGYEDNKRADRRFDWYDRLVEQFATFPAGKYDDIVDACFPAGTGVQTNAGRRPIESIRPGDFVATRFGYRRVLAAGLTSYSSPVLSIGTTGGIVLRCTPNHPIYKNGSGFVSADSLRAGDGLISWEESRLSCIAGSLSAAIPTRLTRAIGIISRQGSPIRRMVSRLCTGKSGRTTTAPSRTDATSTTTTRTRSTTTRAISSASPPPSTGLGMAATTTEPRNISRTWRGFDPSRPIGTGATKAGVGTESTHCGWPLSRGSNGSATSAENPSIPACGEADPADSSAPLSAPIGFGRPKAGSWARRFASNAASLIVASLGREPARVSVVRVFDGATRQPVYNLSVEGHPEYFAEGILVHNCSGAFNKLALDDEPGGYATVSSEQYAAWRGGGR